MMMMMCLYIYEEETSENVSEDSDYLWRITLEEIYYRRITVVIYLRNV